MEAAAVAASGSSLLRKWSVAVVQPLLVWFLLDQAPFS